MAGNLQRYNMANYQKSKFKDTKFGGTDGITTPAGATGDRPATPELGTMRYNTDLGFMEQYNATGWAGIDAPPTVTGFSGIINEDTDSTITVNGTNFKSGSTVAITGPAVNNVDRTLSTTYVASNELTVQTNSSAVNFVGGESFGIKVTNPSGLSALLEPAGNIDRDPVWSTGAGTVATIFDDNGNYSPITTLGANDPDGTGVTFTETTSTLSAAGMTLNSNGTITGNPENVTGSTTVTFTANATSNTQSVPRTFNIIVNPYPDGDTAARAFSTMDEIADIGYTGVQTLWTTLGGRVAAFRVNIDFETANGPWLQNRLVIPSAYALNGTENSICSVGYTANNSNNAFKDSSGGSTYNFTSIPDRNSASSTRLETMLGISSTGGFATGTSGGSSGQVGGVAYYNFGEAANFTAEQQFALYAQINRLSPHTPMWGANGDSDQQTGTGPGVAWDNSSIPSNGSNAHVMVIGAEYTTNVGNYGNSSSDWHKITTVFGHNQESVIEFWTEDTRNEYANGSKSSRLSGGTPSGLEYTQFGVKGSYGGNNELRGSGIYPKAFRGYTGSGGGVAWGYYPSDHARTAGGGNYPFVFLTKDYTV